jgi:pilus assembly protein CpaD
MIRRREPSLLGRRARGSLPLLSLPLLAFAALLVTGCREHSELDDATALRLSDPEKRHPIHVSRRTETMAVAVPDGAGGLGAEQAPDVRQFLVRYKADGAGPLTVSLPNAMAERLNAAHAFRDLKELIRGAGIPPGAVATGRHQTGPELGPTLRLSYKRPVKVLPRCGNWPEDVGLNPERVPYPNFGCATQRNTALMVANPRDIVQPQEEAPRSSERRSVSWNGYTSASGGPAASNGGGGDAKASPAPMGK